MSFGSIVFTNQGRNLQAKAETGVKLSFTRIAMGDGELSGQSISELTNLIHWVKDINITTLKPLSGGYASVGGRITNQGLATGFYWREVGLFATDPNLGEILYCYGNARALAEYIPAYGGGQVLDRYFNIEAIIGNASNVSAIINESLVYVTRNEFDAAIANAGVPSGVITMWSGSIATIPPGWNLCDGTNGTPDLRNRFVVGAGSSYGVGDAGGSNEVTLSSAQMPSHSHGGGSLAVGSGGGHSHGSGTLSTNTAGSHTHTYSRMATSSVIKFWSDDTPANGVITSTVDTSSSGSHSHSLSGSTSAAGDHSHSLSGSTASQGGGAAHENRPPYYALAYIMKL